MELLRSVLELWRLCFLHDRLELGTVASLLAAGGPQTAVGVQVLAALLVNGLGSPVELAGEVVWRPVVERLASRARRDYQAAAETVGLLLRRLDGEPAATGLQAAVTRRLERMAGAGGAEERERWLVIIWWGTLHTFAGSLSYSTSYTCTTPRSYLAALPSARYLTSTGAPLCRVSSTPCSTAAGSN
jgi:hypothetical protein